MLARPFEFWTKLLTKTTIESRFSYLIVGTPGTRLSVPQPIWTWASAVAKVVLSATLSGKSFHNRDKRLRTKKALTAEFNSAVRAFLVRNRFAGLFFRAAVS
jgi:hypothetical protein